MQADSYPTFLICDNNALVNRLTKWRLEQLFVAEINVIMCFSGGDVVNIFRNLVHSGQHPNLQLIMLGCHLFVCTGMEAVAFVRDVEVVNNISRPVEIIGTATDVNDEVYAGFMQAGANIVLTKPVSQGELEEVCAEIVARKLIA